MLSPSPILRCLPGLFDESPHNVVALEPFQVQFDAESGTNRQGQQSVPRDQFRRHPLPVTA